MKHDRLCWHAHKTLPRRKVRRAWRKVHGAHGVTLLSYWRVVARARQTRQNAANEIYWRMRYQ